ncbi:Efflux pump membrane transporter BepE [Alphaproteobacteria bacterium SO-S41]|nr:Efflux pump membrane transporter BepE [Alphaproteobacteria bacterium SO-S41]
MILSDISVKRPVFATVLSLLLIAFGVLSFIGLPLRELPNIDPPVVSISTTYPGASADVVQSRITEIIEDQVAGIEGIDTITSRSRDGTSDVTIEFTLSRDIEAAANDVRDAVARVLDRLPDEVDAPQVSKADADADPIMWLNFSAENMDPMALTEYANRVVVDQLSIVDGVSRVMIGGGQDYAMNIWLDRQALAARGLAVSDVEAALRAQNIELPAGRIESGQRDLTVRVNRSYQTAADFGALVITRGADGYPIRLADVARVELGSANEKVVFRGNGVPQIGMGVVKQSTANTLDVARGIKAEIARITPTLPAGMALVVANDTSIFVEESVNQVYHTIFEAMLIVVFVIFIFLGNVRAALIPAVTVPVCIIGSFIVLYAMGGTINLLTLLALVLAIGLVVDDAIVVLENIQRRISTLGEPPRIAATRGTSQVAFAVVATTTVLIVVFVPIFFLTGNIGRLFSELAIAISGAIFFSGFVALTLTPMMCSLLLKRSEGRFAETIHRTSHYVEGKYGTALEASIRRPWITGAVAAVVLGLTYMLWSVIPSELAPTEDRAGLQVQVQLPEGASFEETSAQMDKVEKVLLPYVTGGEASRLMIRVPGGFGFTQDYNSGRSMLQLSAWEDRARSQDQISSEMQGKLSASVPGARVFISGRGGLGQRNGKPVGFVLGGNDFAELAEWRDKIIARAAENPRLISVDSDYRETKPQLLVTIDKQRAADLGVSTTAIGQTLETMLGSRLVTTFLKDGEEYDVKMQAGVEDRRRSSDLTNIFVRSSRGALIPLSNLVTLRETAGPSALNRFNRSRSITIDAGLAPGYTLGEALTYLQQIAAEELPPTARIDYQGQSREFKQSSAALYFTFGLALLVVFLVLSAQFESFVHPFVILCTVPLAVFGAVAGLWLVGGSLNIYSQIGIIMLVGLATKNGILIVEFANQLRDEGKSFDDAIIEAAKIRLRPIVMTSLATAAGALPLVIASGAGAASRESIGIVIFAGMLVATAFTLFVIPTAYSVIARRTGSPLAVAHEMEAWEREEDARKGLPAE